MRKKQSYGGLDFMKKIICLLLAIATIFCFVGCNKTPNVTTETTTVSSTEEITSTTFVTSNIPTTTEKEKNINFLHDYNQDVSIDEDEWLIDDMTYSYGKFYYNEEIIFDINGLNEDFSPEDIRLLGCSTSSEGVNYIVAKYKNNIGLIKEKDHKFELDILVKDAVESSELLKFNRNDRYCAFYNNDAVMYERTVLYRSTEGGIVQIDIWNDCETINPKYDVENPVLITDYSGIFWLEYEDFDKELEEILDISCNPENRPEHYINREGYLIQPNSYKY